MDRVQPNAGQPVNLQPTIIVNQITKTNGMAVAGFVLALLGLLLCWVPVLDWILWVLGVIFSFVGMFRTPRGFAIAGLIISFIGVIILLIFGALIAAVVAL